MLFESQIRDLLAVIPWFVKRKEKRSLRAIIEQRRRVYDKEQAAHDAKAAIAQIEQMTWFREAKVVMIYYPIHNELDLRGLIKKYGEEKTFLLPVTHRKYIEPRKYEGEDTIRKGHHHHIPEPQTAPYDGPIDLIIVPGVVFDKQKNRIGRGGGYYDKFLKEQRGVHQIGVCYDFQLRKNEIPHFWFDRKVDRVVTPSQTIE